MQKIVGKADWHYEAGIDVGVWTVLEDGKKGHDAIHIIKAGDHLTIWNKNGSIAFQGTIKPYGAHAWTQDGWQPDDWAKLFIREPLLRAELIKQ